jgi:hypothetical protein
VLEHSAGSANAWMCCEPYWRRARSSANRSTARTAR